MKKIFTWRHYWAYILNLAVIRNITPARWYITQRYYECFRNKPDFKNPVTFNEKLQWLKVYNRKPEYTMMADKYAVREYVAKTIGKEYLIPLVGGPWKSFERIDFNSLPDKFVLKCTHDCASAIVCDGKKDFNISDARKKLSKSLKYNFYYYGREWPYKKILPQIIAEKYISDERGDELKDYKFMCFNGKVKCVFVCSERHSEDGLKVTIFNRDWRELPFERRCPKSSSKIDQPKYLTKMIELSERLAQKNIFIRSDFYEVNDRIYFGEITFFPGSGFENFIPEKYDEILGSWLKLQ